LGLQLLFFRTPSDPATNTSEFPGLPAACLPACMEVSCILYTHQLQNFFGMREIKKIQKIQRKRDKQKIP
jgi:hypothetical protein